MAETATQKRIRLPDNVMSTDTTGEGKKEVSMQFSTNPLIINLMRKTLAENLRPKEGKIFIAQRTDKIIDVWKGLIKHNFLSVPVLQQKGNKYYGFLDLADIVKFVVQIFGESKLKIEKDFWELTKREEYFQNRIVKDLMVYPLSRRNPFRPISRGYSLLFVAEMLTQDPNLQRVPILDENNLLVGLISQSHLVSYLYSQITILGDVKNKPISQFAQIGLAVTVKKTDTAIEAFQKMVNQNIYSVAVVDAQGILVDNLSVKDLKAISSDATLFWRLFQDVDTFLTKLKSEHGTSRPKDVVCVTKNATLETVVRVCSETGIHRVWIVDDNKKPINVVTLKHVLHEIITN